MITYHLKRKQNHITTLLVVIAQIVIIHMMIQVVANIIRIAIMVHPRTITVAGHPPMIMEAVHRPTTIIIMNNYHIVTTYFIFSKYTNFL